MVPGHPELRVDRPGVANNAGALIGNVPPDAPNSDPDAAGAAPNRLPLDWPPNMLELLSQIYIA